LPRRLRSGFISSAVSTLSVLASRRVKRWSACASASLTSILPSPLVSMVAMVAMVAMVSMVARRWLAPCPLRP
jgi:hypothetical protein